jgi:hypothetical protein
MDIMELNKIRLKCVSELKRKGTIVRVDVPMAATMKINSSGM